MKKYCMRCMCMFEKGDVCPKCGEIKPQKKLPHLLLPGTILKERYLVGYALGQGGFGITYIGCDLVLNLRVAIKEYYPNGSVNRNIDVSSEVTVTDSTKTQNHEEGKDKFLREARVLAEFHEEEGIVDVRDYFKENNTAYIVMEYLDGVTLQQCIEHRLIDPKLMVKMIRPVIHALEKVHERQVIHRDISPDNIMVLKSGKLKLMDFGAARQVDFSDHKSLSVVLKMGFAPVEQYRSRGSLGPWTDVYALCATLYACMTGKVPENSVDRAMGSTMQWPSEMGVPVSKAMEEVLKKGMEIPWKERYQSMEELLDALDEAEKDPGLGSDDGPATERDLKTLTKVVSKVIEEKEEKKDIGPWVGHTDEAGRTIYAVDDLPERPLTDGGISMEEKERKKRESEKREREKRERTKKNKEAKERLKNGVKNLLKEHGTKFIAAVAAIAVIVGAVVGIGSIEKKEELVPPSYMTMMSDAKTVLQQAGITGTVSSMQVAEKVYNEKFHTYKAECAITMLENQQEYQVSLVYDEKDGAWSFSALSKVNQ